MPHSRGIASEKLNWIVSERRSLSALCGGKPHFQGVDQLFENLVWIMHDGPNRRQYAALQMSELDRALDALFSENCVYFAIRHHSPACAWHLGRLIRELKPTTILVEGPASFTPLIPTILDAGTKPPVAIYTHFIDVGRKLYKPAEGEPDLGPARFVGYYPFCEYSPELIALRVGREVGANLRFIDLDHADQVLTEHRVEKQSVKPRIETLMEETHLQQSAYLKALAERSGCRDFNEMWDHLFESDFQSRSTESFMREVATYCYFARRDTAPELLEIDGTNAREQAMAACVEEEKSSGTVLIVTGGFHTIALPQLVEAGGNRAVGMSRPADSVQQALIRYSFEQLDALNGYSSGMPSPNYYNRFWRELDGAEPDPHATVATELLVEIGALTRRKDMQIALSTADEIAALQQARLLAALRGHPGPTREDLLDGVRSCFVKGAMDAEGTVLMGIVSHLLTGKEIGDVPAAAGVPPIISSFRKECERARLDISDSLKKRLSLELYRKDNHRRTSRLLHCLNFLGIPFAALTAGPDFVRGTGLERIHEHWQYAWSPMTEGALISVAVYGSTIEEATTNRLREVIAHLEEEGKGRSAKAAVSMLINAFRMGLHRHTSGLLSLIASAIGEEPSFIEAIGAANQLLLLWQSREPLEAHSLKAVPALIQSAYIRACYLVPTLAQCPENQLTVALDSLSAMRELLAASEDLLDHDLFWEAAARILKVNNQTHAPYSTICGAIAGLLFGSGRMSQEQMDALVVGYLVGISDSERRVGFLRGLLKTCREAAWQNVNLMTSLDQIVASWDEPEFISALPSLRLALADLTPRETDRVAALVASLHGEQQLGNLLEVQISERELHLNARITALVFQTLDRDGLSHWLKDE